MAQWVIKELAAGMTERDLLENIGSCYCVEAHEGHGIESLSLTYIGTVYAASDPTHFYVVYKNAGGGYWYETKMETERGLVTPYEYLFGRKEPRETNRRRKGK